MLFVFFLIAIFAVKGIAQTYVNGNLSTGATSTNGTAAPTGTTWSELQAGNGTIGFGGNIATGFALADDFTVPAGQNWSISKLTFYGYSTGYTGAATPFTDVRVRIFNTNPSVGSPAPIVGNLTTNVFRESFPQNVYRIATGAPGTTRNVWKVDADFTASLAPGTYWIEYQLGTGALGNFLPPSTVAGTVTQAGNNGLQHNVTANTWAPLNDGANRQDMPFRIEYTSTACVAPTASILSQVQYAGPPVNLINESFNAAALPAGWAQQNLSSPIGTGTFSDWFQGTTGGAFAANSAPDFRGASFLCGSGTSTLSNWLFTPTVTLKNGDIFKFFTRTISGAFPDRMQVRMSTNGGSVNVGASATSFGDFSTLLLDINPTYTATGYPTAWTQYSVTLSGLPGAGISGKLAFRYFVENGGPGGANSNTMGIDDVVYTTFTSVNPTTCTGSTANLKVDITGGVSPYNVVINTVPPTTPIVVNNYISGTNIPVTPAVTTQYTLTSVTGCGVGTGNSGTPTIVVSPTTFPALVVNALPSTPICLGNPTLLTASFAGGGPIVPLNLTQNSSNTVTPGSVSCNLVGLHADNSYWRAYNLPTLGIPSANYTVNSVTFGIELANAAGTGTTQPVIVRLYSSAGAFPGGTRTLLGSQTYNIPDQTLSLFTATLTTPVTIPTTSVLVVEVNTPDGQGPGNSFFIGSNALPETAPSYLSAAACGITNPQTVGSIGFPNMHTIINLNGQYQAAATIPPGYTFLWSPTAGIANPTANPVGASPMVTTNYTVLVTAPGGCQGTASRIVVVNQPPTVTQDPVNVTTCDGQSATFSITATGTTPFTYQWQEQVGGVGAWNNASYTGSNTPTLVIAPTTVFQNGNRYRCIVTGTCSPAFTSGAATLTVNALPIIPITPPGPICGGVPGVNGVLLTAGSAPPPVPGSCTTASGAISVPVPDNVNTGAIANIAVSCVPANATVVGVSVNFNMANHTFVGDMIFNLKAPNGTVLNLDKYMTGTATQAGNYPNAGFVNTTISSAVTTPALGTATTTPITGTWRADLINGTVGTAPVQNPAGYVSTATNWNQLYSTPNGTWTLAMADGGPGDVGTLTSWSITINYTTPGTGGSPVSTVWSPATGLFTDANATLPYVAGTATPSVYAAPSTYTVYTVTGTNTVTGCVGTNSVIVNYTPPVPTVTPNPVTMCLGNPAVRLTSSTSTPGSCTTASGAISVPVPDNTAAGANSTIAVSCVPSGATVTGVSVNINMPNHTYVGDMIFNLKAPNGTVLNLDKYMTGTATQAGVYPNSGFVNAVISSAVTTPALGTATTTPITGTWRADLLNGAVGAGVQNPTGFASTATAWNALYSTPNGTWTLAMADGGLGDVGTLTSWSITINYSVGTPAAPAVWTPAAGLFTDANAINAYVAGTPRDTVWTKPTVTTTYQVTVNSLPIPDPVNTTPIAIPIGGTSTPYPSIINVSNYNTTGVSVQSVTLNGVTHTWCNDIDILLQSPTGQNVVLMSDVGGTVAVNASYTFKDGSPAMNAGAANATGTYSPTNNGATDNFPAPGPGNITQATPTLASFGNTANVNGQWKLFVVDDDGAGDQGTITGGWSINLAPAPVCTSLPRSVLVTVNDSIKITAQPQAATVCTDKVTTFSVTASGTTPAYQWQTRTATNATWSNLANAAPYTGVNTATLVITAPPVSLNGNFYRVIITGAATCPPQKTSDSAKLTVNPLPTVVITANPTKLFPGLRTTINSTSTPAAISTGYIWKRDGVVVGGSTPTLPVDVDGLGDYTLTVTDVNGCVGTSNTLTISDSVTGKVFIYPNPSNGQFQVRYYAPLNSRSPRGLNVYDAKGSRIAINGYPNPAPYSRMDVDLRQYGKGVYWLEVVDVNGDRLAIGRAVVL